mgnify:CR=1 FL=1|tara:strand:+ start:235 stop:516 length:282 start_codon:yes stop_codon:yes gene_type:complete
MKEYLNFDEFDDFDEDEFPEKNWYIFRYLNSEGVGFHAVAFQSTDGVAVRAKCDSAIDINFANKLIDDWIKKEFFEGEDLDESGDESVKRHGD